MQINVTTYESRPITITEHSGSITCAPGCSGVIHLGTNVSSVNLATQKVEVNMRQENNQMALIDIEDLTEQLKEYVKDNVIQAVKDEVISAVNDHTDEAIKQESENLKPLIYAGL